MPQSVARRVHQEGIVMIELKNITKIYNPKKHNRFRALNGITFSVNDGEFCAIIGKSGSGKSTLLHIIGMLDTFSGGEYFLNGKNVSKFNERAAAKIRARSIGFVKQDFALIDEYSALDNVMIPLYSIKASDKKKKALLAIEKLGIINLANKEVSQLSGGEKQRVAIARAIVNDPKIILADEPTGSLDSKTAAEIMSVFKRLNDDGKTVIIVTHDLGIAKQCDRIIEISDGEIVS